MSGNSLLYFIIGWFLGTLIIMGGLWLIFAIEAKRRSKKYKQWMKAISKKNKDKDNIEL